LPGWSSRGVSEVSKQSEQAARCCETPAGKPLPTWAKLSGHDPALFLVAGFRHFRQGFYASYAPSYAPRPGDGSKSTNAKDPMVRENRTMGQLQKTSVSAPLLQDHHAPDAIQWTAGRLLADGALAYGSIAPDDDVEPLHKLGTVYALPRHRHVLDWRKACLGG
jgi:hypothetical protein